VVAERLGALLIVDDIQAGCGRTGEFFSFEQAGIIPDLVCLAKSIGGSGLPMALLLIKPQFDQWSPGEHNGTFRGNNLAFVSATAALEFWRDDAFAAQVDARARTIRGWVDRMEAEWGPDRIQAKGRGAMSGLAFCDHQAARRVAAEAFHRKVVIETSGPNAEVLKLLPPLTIEPDLLARGLHRLACAIETVMGQDRLRSAA
jgi:diaminobutyrate-2-oxoglutarate transaminase